MLKDEPHTYHMQNHQGWGNRISWTKWPSLKLNGHLGRIPNVGDMLTCDFKSGAKHQFKFISVDRCMDPSDMFFAEVEHVKEIK